MTAYGIAPGVAVVSDDDSVYVAHLPNGPILVLSGPAAVIWREARAPAPSSIAQRVAAAVDKAEAAIAPDVDAFVASLVADGVLVPRAEAP